MDPSHGAGHGDGHKLGLPFILGEDHCQTDAVLCGEEHAVESVLDVVFAEANGPKPGVGVPDLGEDAVKSTPELHCLRRRVMCGGFVDGAPAPIPGVIADESGFAVALLLDSGSRQLEGRFVLDQVVG